MARTAAAAIVRRGGYSPSFAARQPL